MAVIQKTIGRLPVNLGDYDSTRAYGRKNRVTLYGCEWESLVENNTYPPATLVGGVVTPDTTHWRLNSGVPENYDLNTEIGTDNTPGTIKGRIKSLEDSVGTGGTVDQKIAVETTRATGAESALSNRVTSLENEVGTGGGSNTLSSRVTALESGKADKATTIAGYGITDAYTQASGQALEDSVAATLAEQDSKIDLLNGSEVVVVADHTAVSDPDSQKVYRQYGTTSYTDWMYQNGAWQDIATYSMPGIDNEPTAGSENLVKSGGVYNSLHEIDKQINGGNEEYDADIQTTSATYVRPAVHYAEVDIPQGTYNLSVNLHGTFNGVVVYFYDENNVQITGIKDKDNHDYNNVSTGNFIYNPFTFPKEIKRIGLYGDNKITDGTIEVSLSTEIDTGIVGKIADIVGDIANIEEEIEGKADKTDIDNIEEVVFGNNNSNSFSVLFKANVPINATGSQYPTNFNLKAGTYILNAPKPSSISDVSISIYFYDENNNRIVVTDNAGATYNNMSLPPYDSRQPFTFPTDVDHVIFYGGTPSVDATLVFKATDVNGDKNVRELAEEAMIDAPEVVFPRKLYLLSSNSEKVENSIYHKHYMSYQNPIYAMDIRRGFGWRYTSRCFRVDAQGAIQNPTMYLRNIPKHTTVATFNPSIITGLKNTDNGRKVINVIGDSFTYNGIWYNEINNLCPNLAFVGMRQSYDAAETLKAEGRGGWRLSNYFEPHNDVTPTHMQPFSPFMHVNGYTYYGVIDFWKVIVNDSSQYTYGTDGFETYKSWFDADGYKINPPTNALMYDGVNDKYVYYNGSSWADFNGTPTFVFDYSKYISTWNIESPDFVMVLLGTNEFGNDSVVSDAVWNLWKERMDILITSVRAYGTSVGKTITIGICTPTVRYGADNGSYGVNQDFYAAGTYSGRKHIIDAFDTDTYEGMNVFVVDTGTAVDTEYGWMEWDTAINEKPFAYYEGTFREFYGYNEPHPSNAGYKQIGVVGAAFIQAKR